MTLYQIYFLDRIPLYAILSESVDLAKKHLSSHFAKFLNAAFRNFEKKEVSYPSVSIAYSYPPFFTERVPDLKVLAAMNHIYPVQARIRKTHEMTVVTDFQAAANDCSLYIQNSTFVALMKKLSQFLKAPPETILDLASAPGGKLILAHDLFPDALLFANDLHTKILQENLIKYHVKAHVTEMPAENYPNERKFDLIICDLPCSNTGVLGKRPEARWRLNKESVGQHQEKQLTILQHAQTLLKEGGHIWYMTCSILKEENEEVVFKSGLKKIFDETHLPTEQGEDGGYGAVLELL
jgi:16S rRNA (cytosine967-C5)-methyltransferase